MVHPSAARRLGLGDPPLSLGRLDELLAETVRSVKAA
jgi:hypothetical protein